MTDLRLTIAGRGFSVTCAEGEEAHIQYLASIVDQKARAASENTNLTETRLLLFSSLFLADELAELRNQAEAASEEERRENSHIQPGMETQANAINGLAERIEKLAASLEELNARA